ncbi:MAG: CvpA family protein [Planktomarina sp.]
MANFTIVDGVVAVVIILSSLLAYSRGFMREAMAIAGWVGAAILAFVFADTAQPLVRQIPYVGDFLGGSCELLTIASFALVFAAALVVVSLFTPLLSSVIHQSMLGAADQALGFVFGVVRGVLLVMVVFFIYMAVLPSQNIAVIDQSRSAAIFGKYVDDIQNQNPEQAMGWVQVQYDQLISTCR